MRALYDKAADALQIDLHGDRSRAVHTQDLLHGATVGLDATDRPIEVEVPAASEGLQGLDEVAICYGLDREDLEAAAQAALSAPNREVLVEVASQRSSAV